MIPEHSDSTYASGAEWKVIASWTMPREGAARAKIRYSAIRIRRGPVGGASSSSGTSSPLSRFSARPIGSDNVRPPDLQQPKGHHADDDPGKSQSDRTPSGAFDPGEVEPEGQRQQDADRVGDKGHRFGQLGRAQPDQADHGLHQQAEFHHDGGGHQGVVRGSVAIRLDPAP